MKDINYPDYYEQNKEHYEFIEKMEHFLKRYKENDKELTFDILSYLHHWVYSHTVKLDVKYGQYLIQKQADIKK